MSYSREQFLGADTAVWCQDSEASQETGSQGAAGDVPLTEPELQPEQEGFLDISEGHGAAGPKLQQEGSVHQRGRGTATALCEDSATLRRESQLPQPVQPPTGGEAGCCCQ